MADELQDPKGFRTRVRQHLDGRRTLLRTRNGFPEYVTIGTIDDLKCLLSPLEEKEATGEEASMFDLRKWHEIESDPENPSLDHAHDLVSSDGLFSIAPTGLAEWVCKSGDGRTITFFFAEQFPADEDEVAPEPKRIIERSWADRTWHAAQMARISAITLPVLYFVIERLKSITLLFGHRTKPFVWTFSEDGADALTAKGVACMEHDGAEFSIAARTDYANGSLKSLSLRIFAKRGDIITADPGGWLGALDGPSDGPNSGVELVTLLDTNATNLSRATACGQPWHGWLGRDNMTLLDDAIVSPPNYSPWGGTAESAFAIAPYQTHYVAIPGLPDVPEDTYPADYHANHMRFLKDAVLFGVERKYSPQSSFQLGRYRWFHYSPVDGSVHVLRVEEHLDIGAFGVPFDTPNAHVVLTIFDDGALTLNGLIGSPRQLAGEFWLPVHIPENEYVFNDAWSGWRINDTTVYRGLPDYPKCHYVPMPTSPTGDRIMYCVTNELFITQLTFTKICELTISDDRTVMSGEMVWAKDYSQDGAPKIGYRINTILGTPTLDVYPLIPVSAGMTFADGVSEALTQELCSLAMYDSSGNRVLRIIEEVFGIPSSYPWPEGTEGVSTSDVYLFDTEYSPGDAYGEQNVFSLPFNNSPTIVREKGPGFVFYSNSETLAGYLLTEIAELSAVAGYDVSSECIPARRNASWLLGNSVSLFTTQSMTWEPYPVGAIATIDKAFVLSTNDVLPVGEGQPENLEFSSDLLATVAGVIDGSIFGWTDYIGGNPNPLYSLGYGCLDPRTGEVRCSFDPTLGYV